MLHAGCMQHTWVELEAARTGWVWCSVASAQAVLLMFCGENWRRVAPAWPHSAAAQGGAGSTPIVAYAHAKLACACGALSPGDDAVESLRACRADGHCGSHAMHITC